MTAQQFFGVVEAQAQKLSNLATRKSAERALVNEQRLQGASGQRLWRVAQRLGDFQVTKAFRRGGLFARTNIPLEEPLSGIPSQRPFGGEGYSPGSK